ncbi:hypothetical protein MBAV_002545 [Candidatus Magnetobacterium bavaricum]|uniref:Uncharacterized protein n=1 Tax=Candidatus Magnetobacterium bavaricum TaxID=29290 RepID=A0A0F3GTL5_9BACT|nr:hypothetical protein MBAV_002545 [Candidatus Magnetobacterium bavaricum]
MGKNIIGDEKESIVRDSTGECIGKDITRYYDDGSSVTEHYQAVPGRFLSIARATKKLGATYNEPDGTSKHYEE